MISFVLPAQIEFTTAPKPIDDRVSLRRISLRPVPQELVAVDRFSGRWSLVAGRIVFTKNESRDYY